MANFTVVYDACVLYPAPLRDLLMHLSLTDLYSAKWSNDIHNEWIRNVLKNRSDLSEEKLFQIRDLMNENVRDCIVDDYHPIISTLNLPDTNDHHVLAVAIKSFASIIVTYNLKDFPKHILDQYAVEALHPDDFIMHLIDLNPGVVCSYVKKHKESLKNPPYSVERYLDNLKKHQLLKTVNFLQDYKNLI